MARPFGHAYTVPPTLPRIRSVLYHHGGPHKRDLLTVDGREWLAVQRLSQTAGQQITVALEMIDAFDVQLAPLTKELRAYASRQTGCKALIAAHYGIGPLCAVTILAELGDTRRFSNSRDAVRYGGLEHHRHAIRPASCSRQALPPRTARAALGAV